MTLLVIETATAACSAALLDGAHVVASAHEVVGRGHAERLVPMIAELIDGRAAPAAILVDCGPGSFTGVRVGLAAARAFALAWGVEAYGFSSLALIAAMAEGVDPIAVAIPGGHGELFVQRFAADPLRPLADLASLPPDTAAAIVADPTVYGEGAAALVAARGSGMAVALLPDAAEAWRLPPGLAALPPRPIYGRAPDARLPA
jgi:tRNA threonylcarbamoyladenosine biosynthesis protein TsaB